MNLRQLRYFLAVAETGHFGRAAERLHRSQSPVSLQIQQLEAELGVKLFERTTRRVTLTDAGQVFQEQARTVMRQLETAKEAVSEAALGRRGTLSVGFISSAMLSVLPGALTRFRADYPDVTLELRELTSAEQRAAFSARTIRVGPVRLPLTAPELELEPVLGESLVVTLPKGHPLEHETRITPQQLAAYPLISFPPQLVPGAHAHLIAVFLDALGSHRRSRKRPFTCRLSSAWSPAASAFRCCRVRLERRHIRGSSTDLSPLKRAKRGSVWPG